MRTWQSAGNMAATAVWQGLCSWESWWNTKISTLKVAPCQYSPWCSSPAQVEPWFLKKCRLNTVSLRSLSGAHWPRAMWSEIADPNMYCTVCMCVCRYVCVKCKAHAVAMALTQALLEISPTDLQRTSAFHTASAQTVCAHQGHPSPCAAGPEKATQSKSDKTARDAGPVKINNHLFSVHNHQVLLLFCFSVEPWQKRMLGKKTACTKIIPFGKCTIQQCKSCSVPTHLQQKKQKAYSWDRYLSLKQKSEAVLRAAALIRLLNKS